LDTLHQVMFETLIRERKPLNDEASIKTLFVANGVDGALFDKAFNSVGIGAKVEAAYQRAIGYQSRYVPAIIVNGKFRIDAGEAGSFTRMLGIADYLVARERSQ
jgi:thiol:disulfide interchange protein DsbA